MAPYSSTGSPVARSPYQPSKTGRRGSKSGSPSRSSGTPSQPRSSPSPPPMAPPRAAPGAVQSTTPPRPKPPSLKEYLGSDDVYQQARRGGKRSLRDFLSDINRKRGETKTNFRMTREQMEEDRLRQLDQMRQEFASRGLIHSGLYGKEQGQFQEQFQQQMEQLEQSRTQLMSDLLSQETSFRREQEMAMEMAKQEALARRSARFGL